MKNACVIKIKEYWFCMYVIYVYVILYRKYMYDLDQSLSDE